MNRSGRQSASAVAAASVASLTHNGVPLFLIHLHEEEVSVELPWNAEPDTYSAEPDSSLVFTDSDSDLSLSSSSSSWMEDSPLMSSLTRSSAYKSQEEELPLPARRYKRGFCDDITRYDDDSGDTDYTEYSVSGYQSVTTPSTSESVDDFSESDVGEMTEMSTEDVPQSPGSFSSSSTTATVTLPVILTQEEKVKVKSENSEEDEGLDENIDQAKRLFASFEWAYLESRHREAAISTGKIHSSLSFPEDFPDRLDIDPDLNALPRLPALVPGQALLPASKQLKFSSESFPKLGDSVFTPSSWTDQVTYPTRIGTTNWQPIYPVVKANVFESWVDTHSTKGLKQVSAPVFAPIPGACVGAIVSSFGSASASPFEAPSKFAVSFFSWWHTDNLWAYSIPDPPLFKGRRWTTVPQGAVPSNGTSSFMDVDSLHEAAPPKGRVKIGTVPSCTFRSRAQGMEFCRGGTIQVDGMSSVDGVLWLADQQLMVFGGGEDTTSTPLKFRIWSVNWHGSRVKANHTSLLSLPGVGAMREISKSTTNANLLGGCENGRLLLFSANRLMRGEIQAQQWMFDAPIGSVRWRHRSDPFIGSVTLDSGAFRMIDTRIPEPIESIQFDVPVYSHDYGIGHEIIFGDSQGLISIYDDRRTEQPLEIIRDHSQAVIGDVRFSTETSSCIFSGAPSISIWHKSSYSAPWKHVGNSMLGEGLLTADHQASGVHVPGTSLMCASAPTTGNVCLFDL